MTMFFYLMIGWTVECILALLYAFLEAKDKIWLIDSIVSDVNYIVFVLILFRCSAIEIYMSPRNKNERRIIGGKSMVKQFRNMYFSIFLVICVTELIVDNFMPEILRNRA